MTETVRALRSLILDLPPAGQEYLKEELDRTISYEKNVGVFSDKTDLLKAYQKTMGWVWPNILQEFFRAKPRNPNPTAIGE